MKIVIVIILLVIIALFTGCDEPVDSENTKLRNQIKNLTGTNRELVNKQSTINEEHNQKVNKLREEIKNLENNAISNRNTIDKLNNEIAELNFANKNLLSQKKDFEHKYNELWFYITDSSLYGIWFKIQVFIIIIISITFIGFACLFLFAVITENIVNRWEVFLRTSLAIIVIPIYWVFQSVVISPAIWIMKLIKSSEKLTTYAIIVLLPIVIGYLTVLIFRRLLKSKSELQRISIMLISLIITVFFDMFLNVYTKIGFTKIMYYYPNLFYIVGILLHFLITWKPVHVIPRVQGKIINEEIKKLEE